jgi:hypothetical protein
MSVFTHGVIEKGKPRPANRNQVFTVVGRDNNPEEATHAYRTSCNHTGHRIYKVELVEGTYHHGLKPEAMEVTLTLSRAVSYDIRYIDRGRYAKCSSEISR